jgi:hypothetical protein
MKCGACSTLVLPRSGERAQLCILKKKKETGFLAHVGFGCDFSRTRCSILRRANHIIIAFKSIRGLLTNCLAYADLIIAYPSGRDMVQFVLDARSDSLPVGSWNERNYLNHGALHVKDDSERQMVLQQLLK